MHRDHAWSGPRVFPSIAPSFSASLRAAVDPCETAAIGVVGIDLLRIVTKRLVRL
jgi:hypothetical protein